MKKDLTEKKLKSLEFKKEVVSPEESGDPNGYYYFCYELYNGECLISDANDDIDGEFYNVSFLNMPDAGDFVNSKQIEEIIRILNNGIK